MKRRRMLGLLGGAAAGLALSPRIPLLAAEASVITRRIPSSDETLPAVGLGTSNVFDHALEGETKTRLARVLRDFHAAGARVVDTSPMYGKAEEVTGTLAREAGITGDLFLATKVWTKGKDEGIRQMRESAQRLGRETLDLIQVHNLVDTEAHLDTLDAWKKEGKVRYTGITHYVPSAFDDLERWMKARKPDFVQLCYSVRVRDAEKRLLPLAADLGIAVLANRPFEEGALFSAVQAKPLPDWAAEAGAASWGQLFLKFILGHPAVTVAIPATGKPDHLADNLAAMKGVPLARDHRERLAKLVD